MPQLFLEPSRERVAPRLLGFDRLFEERFAPPRLIGENARGLVQLRLVAALQFLMRDDPPEIGVHDEQRAAARTLHFDLAFQLGHTRYSSRSLVRGFASSQGPRTN